MNSIDDMISLSRITGETVTLGIMINLRFVMLHDIPSQHDLRITEGRDTSGSPIRGATGRVMLSQLSDDEIIRALPIITSWDITGKKSIDTDSFLEEIRKIRKNGYGISYSEIISNSVCIAAPIYNYVCPAAISIVGPENRLHGRTGQFIEELKKYSQKSSNSHHLN
jgi:DNA-binding IclR family transcriptional regulator